MRFVDHSTALALLALAGAGLAQDAPPELGKVNFSRDFATALQKTGDKPVFAQFQEVPG